MTIAAIGSGATTHAVSREVEPLRTPVSQGAIRDALARAHVTVTGRAASGATLDVLTAQASLETASGDRMYNYNFGGIKGSSPAGETAQLRTHEVLGGKDVEIKDGFRAYKTLDAGAVDYVKTMRNRFPVAMAQAECGNTDAFAHALKKSGYYTASEQDYASGLRSLMGQGAHGRANGNLAIGSLPALPNTTSYLGGSSPAQGFADTSDLSRVMDAIGHATAHLAQNEDDNEDT